MKLLDKKVRSVLAGEYVLGLLRGKALARFEKMYASEQSLQKEVLFWAQYFFSLNEALKPQKPPLYLWDKISEKIEVSEKSVKAKLSFGLEFWFGFIFAGVLSLLLALFALHNRMILDVRTPSKDYVAILQDQQSRPVLIASIDEQQNTLILEMLTAASYDAEKVLQVWCLPKTDEAPMSVGIVMQVGITRFELSPEEMILLKNARALAISLEPKGGSKHPTGPILYSGLSI